MPRENVIASGLLIQRNMELLGQRFARTWPVDETACFEGLLEAIDQTERELMREEAEMPPPIAP